MKIPRIIRAEIFIIIETALMFGAGSAVENFKENQN